MLSVRCASGRPGVSTHRAEFPREYLDKTVEEAMRAHEAVEVIRTVANSHLSTTPYSYRKVGARPTLRELIVPFGSTGYVLRFDIRTADLVLVLGARHQREQDYH